METNVLVRRFILAAPVCLAVLAPALAQAPQQSPAEGATPPPAAQQTTPPGPRGPGGGPGIGPGQGLGAGPGPGPGTRLRGWGQGVMMGPWMMGRGGMGPGALRNFCNPRMAGFAQWRANRMERWLNPTDAQKAKLEELKAASAKAAEAVAAACPTTAPATPVEQMQLMEKRMETMLQAIRTVRPAFEAFYASLSDQQKAQLGPRNRWRENGPRRGRGWDR